MPTKTPRTKKIATRIRLTWRQNRAAALFVALWIFGGALLFLRLERMSGWTAIAAATCLAKAAGGWSAIYQSFTEVVVFGAVASVVVTNVTRKYRPEATSHALAEEANGHIVVVGFTHLGARVRDLAIEAGKPVVVVEEDASRIGSLLRDEEPAVIGSPRDPRALEAARVEHAKVVIIATDDLESAAVACRLVRERNETCELVVRCPDEDVGAVLAKTYRARALSTTQLAAELIGERAMKARVRRALVVGGNDLAARVASRLTEKGVSVKSEHDVTEGRIATNMDLVVICDDDLGKNLIRVDRIRDFDRHVRIVCRAFHDDAAEVLTREPFSCVVLSTSRHAAHALTRAGVFRELGIHDPGGSPGRWDR